ncbi:hypothetical protein LWI28_014892 [Acer negundo]|uniref:Translation elongation factor EF1B beta/delta subunit guanine nucleotide exchange domain-containing protein n=1 Tax=Acer negundo TaxID=4023 RepID=A0AAD5JGI6_ACENE|nr:hypothetical protein LWI28_014892 [Acer negundo]
MKGWDLSGPRGGGTTIRGLMGQVSMPPILSCAALRVSEPGSRVDFPSISVSLCTHVGVPTRHIDALLRIYGVSAEGSGVVVEGSAPITAEAVTTPLVDTKATAVEDDDDVDLFGEETEEEKKAVEELAAFIKASTKKKESGKSSVLMDVKPWDDETDMKKLEEAVRSVHMEGLLWGASKLVPVGYGIKKLTIMLLLWMIWCLLTP